MTDSNKLISSLIGYIKEVKPYHTKLLDYTSEIFLKDEVHVSIADAQPDIKVGFKNVWTKDDDERLSRLSEGVEADRIINIPPVVLPRFSLNTFLNFGQTPYGYDPASIDLTDIVAAPGTVVYSGSNVLAAPINGSSLGAAGYVITNSDGIPDNEIPYSPTASNHLSQSHQLGSSEVTYKCKLSNFSRTVTSATDHPTTIDFTVNIVASISLAEAMAYGFSYATMPVYIFSPLINSAVTGTVSFDTEYKLSFSISGTLDKAAFPLAEGYGPSLSPKQKVLAYALTWNITARIEQGTGRFKVPFHSGSYVLVDNIPKTLGVDYTVDRSRGFIQFLAGMHPAPTAKLAFNLYSSDRMFVAFADPFDYSLDRNYDIENYDVVLYGAGDTSDNFSFTVDSSYPSGHSPVVFRDIRPGYAKCKLDSLAILTSTTGDAWVITAVGDFTLAVQQTLPSAGAIQYAALNQPFNNGKLSFTLVAPWVPYYFDLQTGSYLSLLDVPNGDYAALGPYYDPADYYPNTGIKTQQGVFNDPLPPLHIPVLFNLVGKVKQRADGSYFLELTNIPKRGTYVEVRVEQNQQYNTRAAVFLIDELKIAIIASSTSGLWIGAGSKNIATLVTPSITISVTPMTILLTCSDVIMSKP
jgi:hypothetical protein